MKRLISMLAAVLCLAGMISCTKDGKLIDLPVVTLSADAAFTDGVATVTASLNSAAITDVNVTLALAEKAEEGKALLPADVISFGTTITIPAGRLSAGTVVTTTSEDTAPCLQAGFQIAKAEGALVGGNGLAYISFTEGNSYNGGQGGGQGGDQPTQGLQSNWSVSLDGEPFTYDGDDFIYVKVNAPGIGYYFLEENTQADLDEYYNGTLAGLISEWEQDNLEQLGKGKSITDVCFDPSNTEDVPYLQIFNPGKRTTVYLVEFDATGKATGRYGLTTLTMPNLEGGGEEEGDYPYTVADFMNTAEYNYYDFEDLDNGTYDVLIVGMNPETGNLTGEYNIASVTVDGHKMAADPTVSVARKLAGQLQRKSVKERARGIRKGLRADDSDPVMLHRVAVNGVEGYFTFDLFNPGEITQENLQQYMLEAGQYCTDMNEYYKMLWDLLSGYDSGSYSISRRADDDDETEITVTIEGTLKQVNTWTAEYLGCYEDSSDDNLYLAPARSKRFKKH